MVLKLRIRILFSFRLKETPLPNRQLSSEEIEKLFAPLLSEVRERIVSMSGDDKGLQWALRRKLFKKLTHDERGKPMQRGGS